VGWGLGITFAGVYCNEERRIGFAVYEVESRGCNPVGVGIFIIPIPRVALADSGNPGL